MTSNGKNFFASNLLQLQNHIKRDPASYKDEFMQTYHNYESTLQVYLMKPSKSNKQLSDLALFLAHVSHCFPDELKAYPQQLIDILKRYATVLHPDVRLTLCKCLMLIRNKNLIEPIPLFESFFSLIKCPNKILRKTLFTHMLNDVRRIKIKLKNHKQCSQVQQYVFGLTKDSNALVAKYSLNLLVELYKKQIWNDQKTVNVIAAACFSKTAKVLAVALQFFAGKDPEKGSDSESESDEDRKDEQQILLGLRVGKKTKKRQKRSQRALKSLRKEKKKSNKSLNHGIGHFSALHMIYEPQDFVEKLFKLVETTNEGFEIKLAILDLISRLIGVHALYLHNFHSFLLRFLNPHQREVTKILWYAALSSHDLTPPDTVEPVLVTIANNFITERNSDEVIAVGLNAIREICARCPLSMTEHLLGDLVQYQSYKDKAVTAAARSLIQLFREKNPQMLHRKMRGKPTEETYAERAKVKQYGEVDAKSYIPGAEVIASMAVEETKKRKRPADDDSDDDDDEDGEWIEESEEEEEVDDEDEEENGDDKSESDKRKNKKRKHSEDEEEEEDDDDDDSDGGWINVSDDEQAAEGDDADKPEDKLTLEEKEQLASKVSTEKIFTQEDFRRIRQAQLKKKLTDKNFLKNSKDKKKTISIDTDSEEETGQFENNGLIPLTSITSIRKKKAHDRESRLARVQEGREGREKFGHRQKSSRLGKTNKEKLKNKSYMMIRHKQTHKQKRSFKEKQLALKKSLLKQKKMK